MMESNEKGDKKQAFGGMAKMYDKARPTYPKELYSSIMNFWRENRSQKEDRPDIVDVGCGTGISTRAFFDAINGKCTMIGVEPGKDMIATAIQASINEIKYILSSAESLPLPDKSSDIVTAAQAVQWFDRPIFYREAFRVLKDKGVIAIYENNRDWENSKFLDNYEALLEKYSVDKSNNIKYSRFYRSHQYAEELSENFKNAKTMTFFWEKKMTPNEFLSMAKTSTQVKRASESIGTSNIENLILDCTNNFQDIDGNISVKYKTLLYIAHK